MATSSLFLRSLLFCLFFAALQLSPTSMAQQNASNLQQDIASSSLDNPVLQDAVNPDTTAAQRAKLEQELRSLLAENSRINQEKIQFLESQSQRVFWTKCLIGFLILMMLVSLFSFWRLHVQHKFQTGLERHITRAGYISYQFALSPPRSPEWRPLPIKRPRWERGCTLCRFFR